MARSKGRVPLTFAVAPELVSMADLQADRMGLDRYDVLRMSIAKGLLQLRLEHEFQTDTGGQYTKALLSLVGNKGSSDEALAVVEDTVVGNIKRDVAAGRGKPKRKKVGDGE